LLAAPPEQRHTRRATARTVLFGVNPQRFPFVFKPAYELPDLLTLHFQLLSQLVNINLPHGHSPLSVRLSTLSTAL
jgi:hypothetical protein